jgi:hypothetical protein
MNTMKCLEFEMALFRSGATMTDDLTALFRSRGILYRDTLLLPPSVALEFIVACRENGVEVLGFDAFNLLSEDLIQPIMDDSLDLSAEPHSLKSVDDGYAFAELFLKERLGKNIFFEMVTA